MKNFEEDRKICGKQEIGLKGKDQTQNEDQHRQMASGKDRYKTNYVKSAGTGIQR